ncbi:MAG: hypothetical protein K0R46_3483 [Herbinix sp.]|nr:hypothetical protein [Herbinix sp.]
MSKLKTKLDLNKFAGGVLLEKFNGALKEVAKITVAVTTKTSPVLPIETALYMGKDLDTGDIEIREYGKQIAGQLSFSDVPEEAEVIDNNNNVDAQPGKVRNLRDARVN